MTRHQFGRLRLPDKIVLPSQCPMSSPGAFSHAWRPIGRQTATDGGQCGPQDRPIADGEAESRMPPCGVSKWRFIAIEFYGVPWHFCAVSMVCVTLGSVTLCGVETYKLTRHSNLYKWSKGHVVSAGRYVAIFRGCGVGRVRYAGHFLVCFLFALIQCIVPPAADIPVPVPQRRGVRPSACPARARHSDHSQGPPTTRPSGCGSHCCQT